MRVSGATIFISLRLSPSFKPKTLKGFHENHAVVRIPPSRSTEHSCINKAAAWAKSDDYDLSFIGCVVDNDYARRFQLSEASYKSPRHSLRIVFLGRVNLPFNRIGWRCPFEAIGFSVRHHHTRTIPGKWNGGASFRSGFLTMPAKQPCWDRNRKPLGIVKVTFGNSAALALPLSPFIKFRLAKVGQRQNTNENSGRNTVPHFYHL